MDVTERARAAARRARRTVRNLGAASDKASDRTIELEYPIVPDIRWGYDLPPHAELDAIVRAGWDEYAERLSGFLAYTDDLVKVPLDRIDRGQPDWNNGWFQGLDSVALYAFLRDLKPATYVEVGSGNSTLFARRAITDGSLPTKVVSIDPQPRAGIDELCDELVRAPFESAELDVASRLSPGDVLFVDGSHYCLQNSDVTVLMTEVLPRLPAGVWVHFHDIFLPWDYPPQFRDRYYSEQYVLASWLLAGERAHRAGGTRALEVRLPNFFISVEPDLHHLLSPLWKHLIWSGTPISGLSFWVETI